MQEIKKPEFVSSGMHSNQQMPFDPFRGVNRQGIFMKGEPDPLDSNVLIKPLKRVKISPTNDDSSSFEDDSDINESDYENLLNHQIDSQNRSIPSFTNANKPRFVTNGFFGECAINTPMMIIKASQPTVKRNPKNRAKPSASNSNQQSNNGNPNSSIPTKKKTKKTGWTSPHSEMVDLGPKMKLPAPDLDPTNEKDFADVLDPNYRLRGNFAVLRLGHFASKIFGKSVAIMSLRSKEELLREDGTEIDLEYEEIQRNYQNKGAYFPKRDELLRDLGVIS